MTLFDDAWKRIETMTAKWQDYLDMGLRITHRRLDTVADEPMQGMVAETKVCWEYRQASILWYVPNVCTIEDDELERIVIHEFLHALLAPIEVRVPDKFLKEREFAVQSVTDAILHLKGRLE